MPVKPRKPVETTVSEPEVIEGEFSGMDLLGSAQGLLHGAVKAIPGGEFLATRLGSAVTGQSPQEIGAAAQKLEAQHGPEVLAGQVGGTLAMGAALPGAGAGLAGVAAAAGQAALLTPAYKLGEIAQQAQLQSTPLRTEQIAHALFSTDSLYAGLLGGLLHTGTLGVEAAGSFLARAPAKQAGKLFSEKTAARMGGSREDVGRYALESGLLKPGRVEALKAQAGAAMGEAAQHLEPDAPFLDATAEKLREFAQGVDTNEHLALASRKLLKQADKLGDISTGVELDAVVQGLKSDARKAGKDFQKKQFLNNAAQVIRNEISGRLQYMNPDAAGRYDAAVRDYHVLSQLSGEATKGAAKQFTASDLGGIALKAGVNHALGGLAGTPGRIAEGIADLYLMRELPAKNYATFLDAFAKNPPFAWFARNGQRAIKSLFSPASAAGIVEGSHDEINQRYDELQHTLRAHAASPEPVAQQLRSQLDFLPPHEADAVTAHTMDKLAASTISLPASSGPATITGVTTGPTDREKRAFLEKHEVRFDPYKALASGRADLIAEAERYNPEVMHALKQKAIAELQARKDLPYETRRRLGALLGVPGTALQDPALGVQLQNVIQTRRQAESQAGQIESTRQVHATMKNNKAALTRAQRIVGAGSE